MSATPRIAVTVDGSELAEQAIPYASAVAGRDGTVTLIHVMPSPEPLRGLFGTVMATVEDVERMERDAAAQMMDDIATRWTERVGNAFSIAVTSGDPAESILRVSGELEATVLVMASRGHGALGRLAFGSVADRIARTAPIPVMVVNPPDSPRADDDPFAVRRVVVPLDGSEIAAEALPVAADLAKATGATVHLITAVNAATMVVPTPIGSTYYPAELYQEITDELIESGRESQKEASSFLEEMGQTVTSVVIEGPTISAIESQIEDGDVIVMTSHGRGGFQRWLLGSVAEKLVRSDLAPVVLVPAAARVAAST